jgi:endonuclease YncB( thermonuclease family)
MNIPATWLISIEGLVGRSLRLICRSLAPTLFLGLVCLASSPGHGREIESYAIVRDDGSLRIQGRNLRLFGIFIPDTGRVCGKTLPACGSRAALALDALLEGRGFVRCRLMGAGTAICYVPFIGQPGGRDLATHLLVKGLAVASPEAPRQYRAVERWARLCGIGIRGRFRPSEPAPSGLEPCHLGR